MPHMRHAGANAFQLSDDGAWPDRQHLPKIILERAQVCLTAAAAYP